MRDPAYLDHAASAAAMARVAAEPPQPAPAAPPAKTQAEWEQEALAKATETLVVSIMDDGRSIASLRRGGLPFLGIGADNMEACNTLYAALNSSISNQRHRKEAFVDWDSLPRDGWFQGRSGTGRAGVVNSGKVISPDGGRFFPTVQAPRQVAAPLMAGAVPGQPPVLGKVMGTGPGARLTAGLLDGALATVGERLEREILQRGAEMVAEEARYRGRRPGLPLRPVPPQLGEHQPVIVGFDRHGFPCLLRFDHMLDLWQVASFAGVMTLVPSTSERLIVEHERIA